MTFDSVVKRGIVVRPFVGYYEHDGARGSKAAMIDQIIVGGLITSVTALRFRDRQFVKFLLYADKLRMIAAFSAGRAISMGAGFRILIDIFFIFGVPCKTVPLHQRIFRCFNESTSAGTVCRCSKSYTGYTYRRRSDKPYIEIRAGHPPEGVVVEQSGVERSAARAMTADPKAIPPSVIDSRLAVSIITFPFKFAGISSYTESCSLYKFKVWIQLLDMPVLSRSTSTVTSFLNGSSSISLPEFKGIEGDEPCSGRFPSSMSISSRAARGFKTPDLHAKGRLWVHLPSPRRKAPA